jgi:glucose-6-phosphate 1-dehydrogenase
MECPVSNHPDDIRDEKCRVLRCIPPVEEKDCLLGQYTAGEAPAAAAAAAALDLSVQTCMTCMSVLVFSGDVAVTSHSTV